MAQLDEDSVIQILRRTSPRDLCSLAQVSKTWAAAAASDTAWQPFLPDHYLEIFRTRDPAAPPLRAVDCFRRLTEGVMWEDGKQHVVLDQETGRVLYSVSKDSFGIAWGDDTRYWRHLSTKPFSVFDSIAHLVNVCWFDINGEIPLKLPRGTYSVYWRMSRNRGDHSSSTSYHSSFTSYHSSFTSYHSSFTSYRSSFTSYRSFHKDNDEDKNPSDSKFHWTYRHVSSSIRTANGVPIESEHTISENSLAAFPQWTHLKAGEIVIDDYSTVDGVTHLHARLHETESDRWKSGIYFDGIVLESAED